MRTKHLFTALALVALFASCAKEEFAPVSSVESSERAVVENVSFNFVESATTRLFFDGKYKWEAGDQLGACLMDVITGNYGSPTAKWNEKFDLVDYIQTNYKFTRDAEGNWETEAKLCEGNYFLAYPYNKNKGLREAYTFECADQTLEGTSTPELMDAFVKNTSFVGYAPVAAHNNDNESVDIDMVPVFESTGFTIKNTGTDSYTIEKIVLSGSKVMTYAELAPKAKGLETELDDDDNYYKFDNVDALSYGGDGNDRIDVAIKSGNTIAPQDEINVIVMSAPAALEKDVLEQAILEIHTDKGLIRGIDLAKKYSSLNGSNTTGTGSTVNVLTDKALVALGVADKVHVTFDDTSLDIPDNMEVGSTDELYRLIRWNSKVTNTTITANLTANVTLTAEMYNILKNKYVANGSTLKFVGEKTVTIASDVTADAMDLVKFDENTSVKVAGIQTISKAFSAKAIVVNSGATLNVKKAVTADVTNKGTVNVNIAYNENCTPSTYYSIDKLENMDNAIVNVNGFALFTELVNNKKGVVNVNSKLLASGVNYGVINNYGTVDASLVNKEYVKDVQNPTINNYGQILSINNNNMIVMKDKSASVQVTGGNGEIDNTIESARVKAGDNTVFVKANNFNASALAESVLNAGATRAYISGTMNIDQAEDAKYVKITKVTDVIADDDLTITGKGKVYFAATDVEFTVAENTETVVKSGSALSIDKGKLTVRGTLIIENNAKVICGSRSGNIKVYGGELEVRSQTDISNTQELTDALTGGNNNIYLKKGDYTMPAGSNFSSDDVLICEEGVTFNGNSKLNINGATIIGATFSNPSGSAVDQTINGVFKDCTFKGSNALRYCYAGSTVIFENCVFDGNVYGVHFDGGANEVTFRNCTISGFNAFGNAIKQLTFEGCTFKALGNSSWNGANLWGSTILKNCEFTFDGSVSSEWIDCISGTYSFENCTICGTPYTPNNYSNYNQIFSRNNLTIKINGIDCAL